MIITEDNPDTVVLRMSKDEFNGLFKTIGETGFHDRVNIAGLTEAESEAVSKAFAYAFAHSHDIEKHQTPYTAAGRNVLD